LSRVTESGHEAPPDATHPNGQYRHITIIDAIGGSGGFNEFQFIAWGSQSWLQPPFQAASCLKSTISEKFFAVETPDRMQHY
jgi:hypothetical protein